MSDDPSHLVERVASRLRGVGGLAAVEPAPERDIRNVVRRDAERRPFIRRPATPTATPDAGADPAEDNDGAARPDPGEPRASGLDPAPLEADGPAPPQDPTEPRAADADGEPHPNAVTVSRRAVRQSARPTSSDPGRAVSEAAQRAQGGSLTDPAVALSMPETTAQPPLDMAALERAGLVVGHKVRTRISEEFRITVGHILRSLHTNYSPGRGSPNVLMVTSARPGEGKSFSTLNLAGSMAQHTQRDVLLVDVDAKQRSISVELGLGDRPGLLDMSTNPSLRVEDVIVRTAIPHLSVVPIGSGHTIGTEHTPARPMATLIERIARRFPNAIVLLDAPPCLSTSDPATLAPYVGQIVMVVEAEKTQRNEIIAALDLIKACPAITLMLNKIKLTTSYTFGAYHYFGTYN